MHGIPCVSDLYMPVYLTPEFGWHDAPIEINYENTKCPIAENASNNIIWLGHTFFNKSISSIYDSVRTIEHVIKGCSYL